MPDLFNVGTNKHGLIVYGGESSADYGMVVAEAPAYERPNRKQTIYTVPGRNGAVIFQDDAWEDVTRSYTLWAAYDEDDTLEEKITAFEAMLNSKKGYQRLEDNFEPEFYRLAYYSGGDGFTNNMTAYGQATINFTCRPERFYKNASIPTEYSNGSKIFNNTRYTAKPLIYVEGTGTIDIAIGGNTISVTMDADQLITIDCEAMNVYKDWLGVITNKNNAASGSFPQILPGSNTIGVTGSATLVRITPRLFTI